MNTTLLLCSRAKGMGVRTLAFSLLLMLGTNGVWATCPNTTAMFPSITDYTIGNGSYAMQTGDFNNDGKLDLITANRAGNNISVSYGNGTGGFGTQNTYSVGTAPEDIEVADFDADGKLDFVTANQGSNTISVGYGTGSTSTAFTTINSYSTNDISTPAVPVSVTIGDYDADGNIDIATGNGNSFSVFDNAGMRAISKRTNVTTLGFNGIGTADVDQDGLPDLIRARGAINDGQPFQVFFNDGVAGWTVYNTPVSSTEIGKHVITGDFDNDGDDDDIFTSGNHNGGGNYHVLLGGGSRSMTEVTQTGSVPSNFFGGSVKVADFNADAKLDVIVAAGFYDPFSQYSKFGFVFLNKGGGDLVYTTTINIGGSGLVAMDAAAGDFTGDGKPDTALTIDTIAPVFLNHYNENATYKTDYNGDGRSDYVVWRPGSSPAVWYETLSYFGTNNYGYLGVTGDIPVPGDYDGDKITDVAVFRPSNGTWYVVPSGGSGYSYAWGLSGDKPLPGDYDNDGKTDFAVWRPSDQTWYVTKSNGGYIFQTFGASGDIPIAGDYDGDAKWDITVYRPSDNKWYILPSNGGSFYSYTWGSSGDKLVPGDYDGDCITDIAVFRPSDTTTYARKSSDGSTIAVTYGASGDIPQPSDFDGDGRTDFVFWNPSSGAWSVKKSSNLSTSSFGWGTSGDVPAASIYPQ